MFQALYRYNNLTEDSAPTVRDLITLNCIVKLYLSNPSKLPSFFFLREFDHRVYPTIGAIDVFISQISTLLHYSPIWEEGEGHNIDRYIKFTLQYLSFIPYKPRLFYTTVVCMLASNLLWRGA